MSRGRTDKLADYDEHKATNPLTDERLIVREAINELIDSAQLEVLRIVHERDCPSTPTDVANQGRMSRRTASSHFDDFLSQGLLNQAENTDKYQITAGGVFVLESVGDCLEELNREQIAFLTRSARSIQLLRTLSTNPATPGELAAETDSPSRTTIWRTFQAFTDNGWSEDRSGRYHLLPAGERALDAYDELEGMIEQAITKAPFLQRLSPDRMEFPTHALADAELVVSKPDSPGLVVGAALKLCDPRTKDYRTLISVYTPTLFRAYYNLVELGMHGAGIIDASVYDKISQNEELHYLLDTSQYGHYNLSRLEESLTLGIALYDDRKVAVGAYNEVGKGQYVAIIISSNDELVEWGTNVYNFYRRQAVPTEVPSPD